MKVEVSELNGVIGLMVRVPIDQWHIGVKELTQCAKRRGIILEVIQAERIIDGGTEPDLEIVFWGSK